MFSPSYAFSDQLLSNIKKIAVLTAQLNNRGFPKTVLAIFEKKANTLSAYASTSIEGNPLPLTEVRNLLKSSPRNIRDTEREVLTYNRILEYLNEKIKRGPAEISRALSGRFYYRQRLCKVDPARQGDSSLGF